MFSRAVGFVAVVALMLMALALAARRGGLAVTMFAVAVLVAESPPATPAAAWSEPRDTILPLTAVLLLAGMLTGWYWFCRNAGRWRQK